MTPKTKVLLIGYPNNPTGAIMTRKDLLAIAAFAEKHDLIVISDEIYGDLTYGGEKHVCFSSLPGMQERTILLNGFSKAYGMTGWRIGYAPRAAPPRAPASKPPASRGATVRRTSNSWSPSTTAAAT